MAKQTFTTGQVLTAAQMTSLQQTAMLGGDASVKVASYTLVAADAGTTVAMNSASTTTITVNTGLFSAGDTVFIQNRGAGVCTVTAGTATVACAGSLALPQNDAGILYFTSASAATFYDFIQVGAASPLTTKGDLYGFSTSDARIPIGTNGHVLTADSTESLGLKWAAAAGGSSFSGARLTKSVGQTLTNNTDTMITWDVETFDVGGYHDNVTNNTRITIPAGKAGYYQVSAILSYAAGGTGQRIIQLAKNGATFSYNLIVENGLGGGGYQTVTFADIVYGAVGDYFEIAGLHSQGINLNIIGNNGDPGASFFAMSFIGA